MTPTAQKPDRNGRASRPTACGFGRSHTRLAERPR